MARLEEPWQLTSYTAQADASLSFACASTAVVYSSSGKGKQKASEREIACFTVQGDGIHLVEVSEQSSLESFALGPSARFTAPALSRSTRETVAGDDNEASTSRRVRRTYAALERDEGKGEIRCWTSEERKDGAAAGEAVQTNIEVEHQVSALVAWSESSHVYAALSDGSLVCLDDSLAVVARLQPQSGSQAAAFTRIVALSSRPKALCVVRLTPSAPVESTKKSKKRKSDVKQSTTHTAFLEIVSARFDLDGPSLERIGIVNLPEPDVLDVSVHGSGAVTVLTADAQFVSYKLKIGDDGVPLAPIKTLSLANLFLSTSGLQHHLLHRTETCVLLAPPSATTADAVTLVVWDISYGVAVADLTFALPGDLKGRKDVAVNLQSLSPDNVSLIFSASGVRSFAFVVPLSLPATSTLASVVGRQEATKRYLAGSAAQPTSASSSMVRNPLMSDSRWAHLQEGEEKRNQALAQILAAIRDRNDAAEAQTIHDTWYAEEKKRLAAFAEEAKRRREEKKHKATNGMQVDGAPKVNGVSKKLQKLKEKRMHPDPVVPAEYVAAIINAVFAADLHDEPSTALMHALISTGAVHSRTIPAGLVSRLLAAQDWSGLHLALRLVPDLLEKDLAQILASASTATLPEGQSLAFWVARIAGYPASAAPLRMALRAHLSLPQVASILDILVGWLAFQAEPEVKADGHEPSLQATVRFTQALLDAHFVALLSDTTLHERLELLNAALRPLVTISGDLQTLRGPLTPYVRLAKHKTRDAPRDKPERKSKGAGERRRKPKHETLAQSMAVGPYAVESFDL